MPAAGTLGAAYNSILVGPAITETVVAAVMGGAGAGGAGGALKTALTRSCNGVTKKGHYANGECEGDPRRMCHSKTGKLCVLRADVSVPTATHG